MTPRFIVATGSGDPDIIDAYLYDYAARIATSTYGGRFVTTISVRADRFHADYLADRIRSGLYGAAVYDDPREAFSASVDAASMLFGRIVA